MVEGLKEALQYITGLKATANYSDDGVSQKTTIKTGVELADVIVPNALFEQDHRR